MRVFACRADQPVGADHAEGMGENLRNIVLVHMEVYGKPQTAVFDQNVAVRVKRINANLCGVVRNEHAFRAVIQGTAGDEHARKAAAVVDIVFVS